MDKKSAAMFEDRIRVQLTHPKPGDCIVVRHLNYFVEVYVQDSFGHEIIYGAADLEVTPIIPEGRRSIKRVGVTWWIRPIEEVIQLMTKKVPLECCVCGQDAGMFHQHHNRDTGYGICKSCVADEIKRSTPQSIKECYGIVGVNYAE